MSPRNKVVVTGIGVICAIGRFPGPFWANLTDGKVGISPFSLPELFSDLSRPVYAVQEKLNTDENTINSKQKIGRATKLAMISAHLAWKNAKLNLKNDNQSIKGLAIGSGHGDTGLLEKNILRLCNEPVYPNYFQIITDTIASNYMLLGPSITVSTACSSGLYAIFHATERIRDGEADLMLAGGTEALSTSLIGFFSSLFSKRPDLCRPFDLNRKGIVVGEGASLLVLESETHALKRGATPLCYLTGGAINCDADDVTGINVNRVSECLSQALNTSGMKPQDIDLIFAHGTGTRISDLNEVKAIKNVYGSHANNLAISGIKSMIGHTSGASGAIALSAAILSIANGIIPPTMNLETSDPDCDLDFVANQSRKQKISTVQVNSFGFGGTNASMIACTPTP